MSNGNSGTRAPVDPFAAEASLHSARGPGEVVLGGFFSQPHLSVGYCRSARILLAASTDDTKDLIPPIFYLVRHSVELALKDLLLANRENAEDQRLIDFHAGRATTKILPEPAWRQDISRTHNLSTILDWVKADLPSYVKPSWDILLQHIDVHEKGSPEWSRYESIRDKSVKGAMRRSFDPPQLIPIHSLVADTEAFIREAAEVEGATGAPANTSAMQDLCDEAQALANQLYGLDQQGLL